MQGNWLEVILETVLSHVLLMDVWSSSNKQVSWTPQTKAINTLHSCQADYKCNLGMTTDQLYECMNNSTQSVYNLCLKLCLKILVLKFKNCSGDAFIIHEMHSKVKHNSLNH